MCLSNRSEELSTLNPKKPKSVPKASKHPTIIAGHASHSLILDSIYVLILYCLGNPSGYFCAVPNALKYACAILKLAFKLSNFLPRPRFAMLPRDAFG